MFKSCSGLTTIDVSNFDTSNVTDMSGMFAECSGLTNILGLEKLNTSNVTNMREMFHACIGLATIDVSNFDTSNVTDMSIMFLNCSNLTNILGMEKLNTSNVTIMNGMFYGCSALTFLDLRNFDVSKVTNMGQMFDGCTSLKTIYCLNDWNTQYSGTTDTAYMFNDCTSLVGGNGTQYSSAYTNGIYANLDVEGKRGYFTSDVSETPTPYALWCKETKTLYFINSNTRYFEGRLYNGVPVTKVWSGTDVTKNSGDDHWSSITGECQKAVFDESFKTVKPQKLDNWFYNASNLTTIEGLEYLDTSDASSMEKMFFGCSSLTSIDVSHFNTSIVYNMRAVFSGCSALKSIDVSHFNIRKVYTMAEMFKECSSLTTLDLNNFHIPISTTVFVEKDIINGMFENCSSLTTIYCDDDWNDKITSYNRFHEYEEMYNDMIEASNTFKGCTSLVGGKGTQYDDTKVQYEYARPDRNGTPGYFTKIVKTYEYTVSSATVGTLYLDFAAEVPEEDLFVPFYVKSIDAEGTLHLKKIKDIIPAYTPVIVFVNASTYTMEEADTEGEAIEDNLLKGVVEATSVASLKTQHGKDIYVLSRGTDSYINFRKAGSGVKTIPANRAYLPYSNASGAKELSIVFDEEGSEATGIDNVAKEKAERTGVYNMAGQRVAKPQHGIYIVNGKKVFIP